MTRYFVDEVGAYIGGFDGVEPPVGSIEVPQAPEDARQVYDFDAPSWLPILSDLSDIKASLKARIDAAAETERLKYITPGAGQAMTYQQKAAEAEECLARSGPQPADFPLLAAEIGITGTTLTDVATIINGQYQAWRLIGAAIEAARLGGKAAIEAAGTAAAAQLAFDAVQWPVL